MTDSAVTSAHAALGLARTPLVACNARSLAVWTRRDQRDLTLSPVAGEPEPGLSRRVLGPAGSCPRT